MGIQYVRRPLALPTDEQCQLTSLGNGIVALLVAGNRTNLATGKPLSVIADAGWQYSTPGQQGMVFPFRKNASVSTEPLPAIGTAPFVTFWAGYPGTSGVRGQTPDQLTMLVGSSDATNGIFSSKATRNWGSSSLRTDTWGAVAKWSDDLAATDDVLTPGKFTALCTVWRKSTIDFYRDGKRVYSYPRNAANSIASNLLVIGSFVTDPYWNSTSDTAMAGRIMGEWTDAQACAWTTDPLRLFVPDRVPVFSATAAAVGAAFDGLAIVRASAAGALSTSITLTGGAAARTVAAGTLSTAIPLAGAAITTSAMSGTLSGSALTLSGAASVATNASGALSTSIPLAGAALARASAAGALANGGATLAGAAVASASAAGTLSTSIRMAGAAAGQASAGGSLATQIRLAGIAAAVSSAHGVLTTKITLAGVAAAASAAAAGALSVGKPSTPIDISKVDPARVVVFEGSGSRIVVFEGSGNRVRFDAMSAKVPTKVGSKWVVDRDPDEESYYAADITDELADRHTTLASGDNAVELILQGVTQLEDHSVQVVDDRTYIVVLLGGVDGDLPKDWLWCARIRCANRERFDKTTWFNRLDT